VAATRTYGQACRALLELTLLLGSDAAAPAWAQRDQVEAAYADLTPAERQPAPRWLKAAAVAAAAEMTIFDAYFCQQAFLNILRVTVNDAWWKREVRLVAALTSRTNSITATVTFQPPAKSIRAAPTPRTSGSPVTRSQASSAPSATTCRTSITDCSRQVTVA